MKWYQKQRAFFDKAPHQYDSRLILNPPLHTKIETDLVFNKVKNDGTNEIIDFGCGTGRLTMPLLKAGLRILSIDISKKSLQRLGATAKKIGLKAKMRTAIPPAKKYDAIVGADILHHLDLDTWLPRFKKSLKKGGKLIFSEPNGLNPFWYPLIFFIGFEAEKKIVYCTIPNLTAKLKKNGFSNIQITGLGLLPRPLFYWSKKLLKFHDSLGNLPIIKILAYRIIIEAEV